MICASLSSPRAFARRPSFGQPDYYTTSSTVCQGVFQNFFEIFCGIFSHRLAVLRPGAEVPDYYITLSRICQEVFQKFFQLFCDMFRLAVPHKAAQCPVVSQLAYYSTFIPFCQHLFAKFFWFGASGNPTQKPSKVFVHLAQFVWVYSCNPAQNPLSPAVFPWGSKQ